MLLLFFNAFGLGMACAAPPGAVAAESLRRGLSKGYSAALLVQIGSLIGDAFWAVVALSGNGLADKNKVIHILLSALGVVLLLKISYDMFRDAWRGTLPIPHENAHAGAFRAGAFLALANPYAIAFWIGVSGALTTLGVNGNFLSETVFFGGFMVAALICAFAMAILIGYGRRFLTPLFYRIVNLSCGIFLMYLCVKIVSGVV